MKKEWFRKLIHASGFLLVLYYPRHPQAILLLLKFSIILYLFSYLLAKYAKINTPLIYSLQKKLSRTSKLDWAPVFLALGLIIVLKYFSYPIALKSAFQVCIGDALASLVGRTFSRPKLPYNSQKSFWGSFSFFLASFFYFHNIPLSEKLLLSIGGALVESLPLGKLDNLIIPLFTAILANHF